MVYFVKIFFKSFLKSCLILGGLFFALPSFVKSVDAQTATPTMDTIMTLLDVEKYDTGNKVCRSFKDKEDKIFRYVEMPSKKNNSNPSFHGKYGKKYPIDNGKYDASRSKENCFLCSQTEDKFSYKMKGNADPIKVEGTLLPIDKLGCYSCKVEHAKAKNKCNPNSSYWVKATRSLPGRLHSKGQLLGAGMLFVSMGGNFQDTAEVTATTSLVTTTLATAYSAQCGGAARHCLKICDAIEEIGIHEDEADKLKVAKSNSSQCTEWNNFAQQSTTTALNAGVTALGAWMLTKHLGKDEKDVEQQPVAFIDPTAGTGGGLSLQTNSNSLLGNDVAGDNLPPDLEGGNIVEADEEDTDGEGTFLGQPMGDIDSGSTPIGGGPSGSSLAGMPNNAGKRADKKTKGATSSSLESYFEKNGNAQGSLSGASSEGYKDYDSDDYPLARRSKKIAQLNTLSDKRTPSTVNSKDSIFRKASRIITRFCHEGVPCK